MISRRARDASSYGRRPSRPFVFAAHTYFYGGRLASHCTCG